MTAYTVTFYSFKGGSGRTTLLLNVAHALLEKSERVLIWDLDVEAPGVHLFPGCSPREAWPSGFLEWLRDTGVAQGQAPDDEALDALMARVYPVPRPADQDGQLLILPAHAIGAQLGSFDLAALHGELGWNELFVRHPSRVLDALAAIRDRLIERFAPTFLLIDSRTGITDLGGLLTAVIPDCTVLVGNYGAQSTDGLLAVYDALDAVATERWQKTPERRRKLDRLLVASPVPSLTRTDLEERRALWRERFAVPPRNFIEIPLIENLLYGEAITVQSAPHTDAAQRYREVAQALRRTRDGWTLERKPFEPQAAPKGARELDVDPHRQLVTRAQRLFSLLGYELGASNADADFVARERSVLQPRAYDARCVPGELGLDRVPTARPTTAGFPLLVGHTARDEVRAAADAVGVLVRTIGDLERQLIDLGAYAAAIRRNFESSELARSYVRQRFRRAVAEAAAPDDDEVLLAETLDEDDSGSVPEATSDALAHAMRWATGEGSQLWLVLGDYGTGKTSFFRRLAYELATRAETDPSIPIPIAIDLRQLSLAASLEALLQQHLRTTIGWHGNPEAVLYLLQTGRIVLLFDAFDEMAAASYGIGVDDQLRMLAGPALARAEVRAANRVLITCRKNFFRDERQIDRVVGSASRRTEVSYVGGLPSRGSAHTSELDPFNPAQVRAFLEYRLGAERAAATLSVINRTYGLRSLAPRPLLLEMIAHSVAGLAERGDRITIGLLYEQYARDWLEHASDASQTTPVQRERLLEHLAARLWQLPDNEIHYDQLADFVAATDPMLLGGLDPQRVDLELRSAAFLIRSPSGHYRFSHKSFLEYFLAREVIRRAADGWEAGRDALTTEQLTAPCAGFVRDLVDERAEARAALVTAIGEILKRPYTRRASENAAWLALAFSRDESPGDETAATQSLTRLALRKGAAEAALGPPLLRGARLEGANLEGWVQVGARFTGAILTGANLARARLLSCDLSGCRLDGANLRGVRLWHSNLDRADLRGASLRGADLDQVRLDGADLTGADLSTSIARRHLRAAGAKLDDANLRGTQWREPRLGNATWTGAAARHAHWRTAAAIDVQPARLRAARPAFIRGVGIDPNRCYLALAEGGEVITIRDLDGSGPLAMRRVDYVVTSLAIAADRSVLAAGGVGGAVTLWSFPDLGPSRTIATPLPGIVEVAIAPDRIVAVGPGGAIAVIDRTGPLDGVAREVVPGVDGAKIGAMTPDGRWVARDRAGGRLEIVDVATGAVAWGVEIASAALAIRGGDLPALAVAGRDGVEVWQDRRALARIDAVAGTTIADVGWVGDRVAILTNDALSGCSIRHWNPWTGDSTTTTATEPGAGLAIKAIAHDQIYASTSDGLVRFEENATRALVSRTGVVGHAYLLDERRILTGGSQGLLLWDAGEPSIVELRGLPAGRQAATAMSADRRLLAIATDGLIHTLELAAVVAAPRAPVDLGGGVAMHGVERLAFSPDGRWLVGAGRRLAVTAVGRKLAAHDGGTDDLACVDVAFAGIEHPLVTAHRDAPIRIWRVDGSGEVRPGRSPWSGVAPHAAAIALTGDGRTLFTGDGDGRVTRHDLARGTAEPALALAPRAIPIRALTLSPDGQRLAVASMGGDLAVIEVADGGVTRCRGHEGSVLAVRWSGDGARLVTASADGSARIWDAHGLVELATLYPDSGAWLAGAYTTGALDDLVLTEGRRCASARLYTDLCVRPDLVQAAVAGRPAPPLTIDFGHAERTLGAEDAGASQD